MKKITLIVLVLFFGTNFKSMAKDTLTILVYPPSRKIDWSTPGSAIRSYLKTEARGAVAISTGKVTSVNTWGDSTTMGNQYYADMGHAITHVNCTTSSGEKFERWSSVTGEEYPKVDSDNIFKKKIGMGVLFQKYIDGYIISGEENKNLLIYYKGRAKNGVFSLGTKSKPRFLQFDINHKSCDDAKAMVIFYEKFHYNEKLTYEQVSARPASEIFYFTTMIDPYESYVSRKTNPTEEVGGNCASYAVGLLKMVGLYDSTLDPYLKLNLAVSKKLIGTDETPVTINSIILGSLGKHWTYEGVDNQYINNYDPQKMWNFFGDLDNCIKSANDSNFKCPLENLLWYQENKERFTNNEDIKLEAKNSQDKVVMKGVRLLQK
jgi:hypothetical protein